MNIDETDEILKLFIAKRYSPCNSMKMWPIGALKVRRLHKNASYLLSV